MHRIYPPRPEKAITPSLIPFYEKRGWVAQVKKNGTCSLAIVSPHGTVDYKTRHWEDHKAWIPTANMSGFFTEYPDSIFVFELLHSKTPNVKNTAYLFDVLRYTGIDLTGQTLALRLDVLSRIRPVQCAMIAETHVVGLRNLYDRLTEPEDEGIVLKDPNSTLRSCDRDGVNAGWQVKCRRSTKNYSFVIPLAICIPMSIHLLGGLFYSGSSLFF